MNILYCHTVFILLMLLLAAMINLSLLFLRSHRSLVLIHQRILQFWRVLLFSSWHVQCKALCIVMNFLVIWSICLRSSFVCFEKFIPLIKFLFLSLVFRIFLARLRYFSFFSFISTFMLVSASNIPEYIYSFIRHEKFISRLVVLFLLLFLFSYFSLWA